jgi:hypothetical protein
MSELRLKLFILIPTLIYCVVFGWLAFKSEPKEGKFDYILTYTFADGNQGTFIAQAKVFDRIEPCTYIAKPLNTKRKQATVLVNDITLRVVYVACYRTPELSVADRNEINRELYAKLGPVTVVD